MGFFFSFHEGFGNLTTVFFSHQSLNKNSTFEKKKNAFKNGKIKTLKLSIKKKKNSNSQFYGE